SQSSTHTLYRYHSDTDTHRTCRHTDKYENMYTLIKISHRFCYTHLCAHTQTSVLLCSLEYIGLSCVCLYMEKIVCVPVCVCVCVCVCMCVCVCVCLRTRACKCLAYL